MATKKPQRPAKKAADKPPRPRAASNKKKPKAADSQVESSGEFERLCPVPIDGTLSKKKYDRIVEALGEVKDKKANLAEISKEKRDAISEIVDEIEVLRKQIGDGTEDRLVRCISQKDFRANKVRVIRTDTREVVEEREMTADDRQETMPGTAKSEPVQDEPGNGDDDDHADHVDLD